jgi:LPXTG-motif cell wall-anchored protein
MKRILSFAVVLALMLTLALPAMAAGVVLWGGDFEGIEDIFGGENGNFDFRADGAYSTVTDGNQLRVAVRFEEPVNASAYNYLVFDMKVNNASFFSGMEVFAAFVSNGGNWDDCGRFNVMGASGGGDWPGTGEDSPVRNFGANQWVTIWVDLKDQVGGGNTNLSEVKTVGAVFFDQGAGTEIGFRNFGFSNTRDGSDINWGGGGNGANGANGGNGANGANGGNGANGANGNNQGGNNQGSGGSDKTGDTTALFLGFAALAVSAAAFVLIRKKIRA